MLGFNDNSTYNFMNIALLHCSGGRIRSGRCFRDIGSGIIGSICGRLSHETVMSIANNNNKVADTAIAEKVFCGSNFERTKKPTKTNCVVEKKRYPDKSKIN